MTNSSVPNAAADLIEQLRQSGQTLAIAESLTGGLICAELTAVPGASSVIVGGVVSYATKAKVDVLGVDRALVESRGAVDPEVARQMAVGVRRLMKAGIGLSCTGVAGPDPQDGHAPGLVYLAVAQEFAEEVRELRLAGTRDQIRQATVAAAFDLVRTADFA